MAELRYRKWITCTPVAFRGDERTFFSRDSGLCCRALQSLGAQARVVMPEPAWDDEPDVQRTPCARLGDPVFWREQEVEAVILYSWADPSYAHIAQAIHTAGIRLFLSMDTGGLMSPFVEPFAFGRCVFAAAQARRGYLAGTVVGCASLAWQVVGLHRHVGRLHHMAAADVIGVVSPIAAQRVRQYVTRLGRRDLTDRIHFVSHPIDPTMLYNGLPKRREVIAVGRWDDPVKRPALLAAVARKVMQRDNMVRFVVVGRGATRIRDAILADCKPWSERVEAYDRLEHDALCAALSRAQISLCTSRSEGFHTVSAEALLCGCSVSGPDTPALRVLRYYANEGRSGTLADEPTPDSLAAAVLSELEAWAGGARDGAAIAAQWRERVWADRVVGLIDELLWQAGENLTERCVVR